MCKRLCSFITQHSSKMFHSHCKKLIYFYYTLSFEVAVTKEDLHKFQRVETSEYRWRPSYATSVGARKRLVTLSKFKIYCLALIFLLLEIEILEIIVACVSSIVKKLVEEKLVKRKMGSIA